MVNALEIKGLSKGYKKSNFCLESIDLSVPKGTIMGVVGKNGAGKTTIINTLFDIAKKDAGEIRFYGELLGDQHKSLKNDMGVVFDTLSYSEEMRIIQLEKVLKDLYTNFDAKCFDAYVARFDLPRDKKFKTFSRGMTMKLSIAVAVSHGAKLLVLDEATAGLDPVAREEILDIFLDFVANGENAVLMASHISSDLERVADYITFLDNGKIILTEEKDNLVYQYGIARMKASEWCRVAKEDYLVYRKRGLQIEVLVKDKNKFMKAYPEVVVDPAKLDEILPLLTEGAE